ncbi:16S rRNA (guanine(966)-N(2))-methyltransferase RsmD [Alkalihalophilus pseudofirmus]|uniref:16S rRNA (Guanine(966)-N(2))-methyltransferase RsmD n=1 Tax=Alkalihalophilus pseudofirmus TaxID=79885 RepID=A0AAJ2NN33_ALKPS|nr:16S rRNA (guanine(966)-N(2))-methyltransferase RsmD [Alkalihalophilus pseudofirmus]MDV2885395.1 16S rRNA (guanine(966)-N(2))-methyltransferase RsmD [Alkalihalophilus pseudofirmus]OLS37363.1 16S rRNA (guanine(966)-N(2))-methyltransferase RsmD [Alkalihalophilus pseudofirmus]WEG15736.1 16S rRNA (guanine(966)-N(2))-methyltransferase RsmD [Alkalihalophilus pseudofirmus]
MRVISGEKKGLSIKAVPGVSTRPTTDKVKESIFNMIGPYFNGGLALDLYAGSGGLGIESLSRGVEKVIFVDQDRKAVQTIKENLKQCGLSEQAEVYRNDSDRALKALIKRELAFSLIFLDPPYAKQKLSSDISIISDHGLLEKEGMIVCEHDAKVEMPDKINELTLIRAETYGDTTITIFEYDKD